MSLNSAPKPRKNLVQGFESKAFEPTPVFGAGAENSELQKYLASEELREKMLREKALAIFERLQKGVKSKADLQKAFDVFARTVGQEVAVVANAAYNMSVDSPAKKLLVAKEKKTVNGHESVALDTSVLEAVTNLNWTAMQDAYVAAARKTAKPFVEFVDPVTGKASSGHTKSELGKLKSTAVIEPNREGLAALQKAVASGKGGDKKVEGRIKEIAKNLSPEFMNALSFRDALFSTELALGPAAGKVKKELSTLLKNPVAVKEALIKMYEGDSYTQETIQGISFDAAPVAVTLTEKVAADLGLRFVNGTWKAEQLGVALFEGKNERLSGSGSGDDFGTYTSALSNAYANGIERAGKHVPESSEAEGRLDAYGYLSAMLTVAKDIQELKKSLTAKGTVKPLKKKAVKADTSKKKSTPVVPVGPVVHEPMLEITPAPVREEEPMPEAEPATEPVMEAVAPVESEPEPEPVPEPEPEAEIEPEVLPAAEPEPEVVPAPEVEEPLVAQEEELPVAAAAEPEVPVGPRFVYRVPKAAPVKATPRFRLKNKSAPKKQTSGFLSGLARRWKMLSFAVLGGLALGSSGMKLPDLPTERPVAESVNPGKKANKPVTAETFTAPIPEAVATPAPAPVAEVAPQEVASPSVEEAASEPQGEMRAFQILSGENAGKYIVPVRPTELVNEWEVIARDAGLSANDVIIDDGSRFFKYDESQLNNGMRGWVVSEDQSRGVPARG